MVQLEQIIYDLSDIYQVRKEKVIDLIIDEFPSLIDQKVYANKLGTEFPSSRYSSVSDSIEKNQKKANISDFHNAKGGSLAASIIIDQANIKNTTNLTTRTNLFGTDTSTKNLSKTKSIKFDTDCLILKRTNNVFDLITENIVEILESEFDDKITYYFVRVIDREIDDWEKTVLKIDTREEDFNKKLEIWEQVDFFKNEVFDNLRIKFEKEPFKTEMLNSFAINFFIDMEL